MGVLTGKRIWIPPHGLFLMDFYFHVKLIFSNKQGLKLLTFAYIFRGPRNTYVTHKFISENLENKHEILCFTFLYILKF